jgi:hypothetical protein
VTWSADKTAISFDFTGTGFVLKGETAEWGGQSSFVFNTELYIDDQLAESPALPANFTTRRHELCWKYGLPKGRHTVKLKILNPPNDVHLRVGDAIIYTDKIIDGTKANIPGTTIN